MKNYKNRIKLRIHKVLVSVLLINLIGPVLSNAPSLPLANSAAGGLATSTNNCNTQYFPIESKWIPVRSSSGALLTDASNDVQGSDDFTNVDIYGTEATETQTAGSAIDWFSTGTSGCFMFRMRVYASATNANGTNIDGYQWVVGLGTGSTAKAWMVVNGANSGGGQVETYYGNFSDGNKYVFTSGVSTDSATAWANSVGSKHYVYWKVPYTDLISILGATTPYGIFAATTQSNAFNLSALNRDCLFSTVTCQTFDFTKTVPVDITQNLNTTVSPPNITSLSVTKGTAIGGTTVTIYGSNLTNSVRVLFGNTAATITSSYSDSVTVTTPTASVGSVDVRVETAAGGFSNTLQNAFKYFLAPTVTTDAASGISSSTARLNSSINARNDDATTSFCWGTSNTLATCNSWETSTVTVSGTDTATVSVSLSGLSNSTTYYFKVKATNSLGSTFGSIDSFTTNTAPLNITTTSPLTSGSVGLDYSNQLQATGGTGTYSKWEISSGALPGGLSLSSSGIISGTPTTVGTTSGVVVKVTDSGGSVDYETYTVTVNAGPPSATTRPASSVATTSATLNALVVANGAATTVSWCMSTDAATNADGSLFSCTQISVTAIPSSVGATDAITSITGSATSLTNNTIYYFQVKTVNSAGTRYGAILSFETNSRTSQSALTVVIGTASKTYPYSLGLSLSTTGGSTSGTVAYEIVPGGTADDCLLSNSSSSATITATTSGTCFIQGTMAGNATYNSVTSASATFTFNKATLTVTPSSHTVTYGSAKPTITPSYSGFVNSETVDSPTVSSNLVAPTCSTTYQDTTTVGTSTTTSCTGGSARNYTLSTTETGSVTVNQASQTVSFTSTAPTGAVVGGSTYTPTGNASSGLTVTITVNGSSSSVCSISAGAVSYASAGTCTLNINQAGNTNYSAAVQVQQSFSVAASLLTQTVTFTDSSVVFTAKPRSLSGAATTDGDGAITYSLASADSAGCSVSANSLTWTSTGTCTVSAVAASTATYNASSSKTATFTITAVTPSLTLTDTSTTYGSTVNLSSLLTDGNPAPGGGAVTYSVTAGTDNCEISSTTLTAKRASGTCTVQASKASSTGYNSTSTTSTVTLGKRAITVKAADTSKTEGATDPAFTGFSITSGTLYSTDTITAVTATRASGTSVGTYVITINASNGVTFSPTSLSDSYTVTLATGTFTINSASLLTQTVTWSPTTSYRTEDKPITWSSTATTNGDGAITYSVTNVGDPSCSIDGGNLTWTNNATGSCIVTATAAATATYNQGSIAVTFTILDRRAKTNSAENVDKDRAKLKGQANVSLSDTKFCLKDSSFTTKAECNSGGSEKTASPSGSDQVSDVTDLTPSTTYYYIFYGNEGANNRAGEVKSFKTLPRVTTNSGSSIAARSAKLNASVSESLTNPKFCYKSTTFTTLAQCKASGVSTDAVTGSGGLRMAPPKVINAKTVKGTVGFLRASSSGISSGRLASDVTYSLSVSGLDPNTTYYFIVYGTVDGTEYDGGVQNFTTPAESSSGGSGDSSGSGSSGATNEPVLTQIPKIISISKSQICFVGSEIVIAGEYFTDGKVTLNSDSMTVISLSSTTIRMNLPQGTSGRKTITVTTPYGSAVAYIEYVSVPKPIYQPIRIPYLAQGSSISLPFNATNTTTYGYLGKLPSGLSINSATGEISGTPTENGVFVLTLTASNICGETKQFVELDIDAPTPNAISHRINFPPGSCVIPDSAKASLEAFLEKAKGLSPRNLIPEIYVSGGGKASDPNSPIADCRQEAICDFLLLENLLGEVLSDVFTGAENRIEIIVYWPRPNDDK